MTDIGFSVEETMLKNSVSDFLSSQGSVAQLRSIRDERPPRGFDDKFWTEAASLGLTGVAIAEAHGGVGFGYTGLGLVLEEVGRNLTVSPYEATVLSCATVISDFATAEQKEELLPLICEGSIVLSLAIDEDSRFDWENLSVHGQRTESGWSISCVKKNVSYVSGADCFLVAVKTSADSEARNRYSVFMIRSDCEGVSCEAQPSIDEHDVGTLRLDNVRVAESSRIGLRELDAAEFERVCDVIAVGLAAEMLGLSEEAFNRTLAYTKEREQFGRKIGSFQALQHRLAILFVELEIARKLITHTLRKLDGNEGDIRLSASVCKAKLGAVSKLVTNEAIQMHGGVGMTDEYDIGFFIKRARVLDHMFGDYHFHLERIASLDGI